MLKLDVYKAPGGWTWIVFDGRTGDAVCRSEKSYTSSSGAHRAFRNVGALAVQKAFEIQMSKKKR